MDDLTNRQSKVKVARWEKMQNRKEGREGWRVEERERRRKEGKEKNHIKKVMDMGHSIL